MPTRIYTTLGGAKEYVGAVITERTGKSITGATFEVGLSLSRSVPPAEWVAPSVSVQGDTAADRIVKLLIDNTTPPGEYTLWVRVTDFPEIDPRVLYPGIEVI